MSRLLLRRLPQAIVVLFGVVTLAFFLTHVVPGDPARLIAGPNASPATVASIHTQLGLDRGLGYQYWTYLRQVVHEACPEIGETLKWGHPSFDHHGIV